MSSETPETHSDIDTFLLSFWNREIERDALDTFRTAVRAKQILKTELWKQMVSWRLFLRVCSWVGILNDRDKWSKRGRRGSQVSKGEWGERGERESDAKRVTKVRASGSHQESRTWVL